MGGELNYKHLGNFVYEIRLTVYRDCYNGVPPFDDPASIGVFDSGNNLVFEIQTPRRSVSIVPLALYNPCIIPPIDVCYEVTTYIDTVQLPPIAGGYQLAYQRCCRNQTIQNIVDPLNTGATYYAHIPDTAVVDDDSNPVFNFWTPPFICANVPFSFDQSATDADGDSLVYELFYPFDGADPANPMPQPPNNPPYPNISWQAPYNTSDMLGGVPMQINPITGLLTCTPNTLGQFVIGVKCKEYRNGVLIGETLRDYQINVVACQSNIVAALQVPSVVCDAFTANFTNNSSGAVSYFWDFGDPNSTSDTSHLFQPGYTYSDTGTFQVMLIAYGSNPGCNDTSYSTVRIFPNSYSNTFTYQIEDCSNEVFFNVQQDVLNGPVSSLLWEFGDGNSSTILNPSHIYSSTGTYNVLLTIQYVSGCVDTVLRQLTLTQSSNTSVSGPHNICEGGFVQLSASGGIAYSWSPSSTLTANNIANPIANPSFTTSYQVSITLINTSGDTCSANRNVIVNVHPKPVSNFDYTFVNCGNTIEFQDLSSVNSGSIISWQWSLGDGTTSNVSSPTHQYNDGNYPVTLYVTSNMGCRDSVTKNILLDNTPVTIDQDKIICETMPVQLQVNGASVFTWTPSSTLNNNSISNPIATPSNTTTYTCIAGVIKSNGDTCYTTLNKTVFVSQLYQTNYTATSDRDTIFRGESANLNINPNSGFSNITWTPDSSLNNPIIYNPIATPDQSITYAAIINDNLGCSRELEKVRIVVISNICGEPDVFIPTGFTPNGDGVNDIFRVRANNILDMYLAVYNRWGEKIFESEKQNYGWDGTYKGKQMDADVFAYYLRVKCFDGQDFFKKGNVTLIR